MIQLILKSIRSRWVISALLIMTIAIGTALISVVETMRDAAKSNFTHTISGTDLIVGARNSELSILLNSVFLRGDSLYPLPNDALKEVRTIEAVEWVVPLSLGDYYNGYPVIGTTSEFLTRFSFGKHQQHLSFTAPLDEKTALNEPLRAVVGAEVAAKTQLKVDDTIQLSHGRRAVSKSHQHEEAITVVGILQPTGTPIDRAVIVSLGTIDEVHLGWENGPPSSADKAIARIQRNAKFKQKNSESVKAPSNMGATDHNDETAHHDDKDTHQHQEDIHHDINEDHHDDGDAHYDGEDQHAEDAHEHESEVYSALLVGLTIPQLVFKVKETIEQNERYALTAVVPATALLDFWEIMRSFEIALYWISLAVMLCAFVGMFAVAMASINQRRREIALYRAIGASKSHIYRIMTGEAFFIGFIGALVGIALGYGILQAIQPITVSMAGIRIDDYNVWLKIATLSLIIIPMMSVLVNLTPLGISYRQQLIKGLSA